jgi:16S rRNA (cytosine967-C5)-methyltransferase
MESVLGDDSRGLSGKDRSLLNAIVFGVLRWQAKLDWVIARFSHMAPARMSPSVLNILRMGLVQVMLMDRVPAFAAVSTSVALARRSNPSQAATFVNAILRQAVSHLDQVPFPDSTKDPTAALAAGLSFPAWLITRWLDRLGREQTQALCQAFNAMAPLTLRVNTLKIQRSQMIDALSAAGLPGEPTNFSPHGIRLAGRGRIAALPGLAQGWFQVQDEAAQLVALAADPQPGHKVLDACAGRGGKTGHLGQLMQNKGTILAVDKDAGRLKILENEMARLGITIAAALAHDWTTAPDNTPTGLFDRVVVDAPCSGLGVLRRNPDAKWRFDESHISVCRQRQSLLLDHLAPRVAPGGVLVYAVCSTEPEEGEQVVDGFVAKQFEFVVDNLYSHLPEPARALITPAGFIRTFPHRDGMDGFFIACLRRKG